MKKFILFFVALVLIAGVAPIVTEASDCLPDATFSLIDPMV
jgi:hypothetical protein